MGRINLKQPALRSGSGNGQRGSGASGELGANTRSVLLAPE